MTIHLFIGSMELLQKKHKQKCQKRVRTLFQEAGKACINFSSTDYLNLASHPYVKEQGISYAAKWGCGPLPTRPLPSYDETLTKSEKSLAKLLGHETVTFYESDPYLFSKITSLEEKPILSTHSISRKNGKVTSLDELIQMKERTKSSLIVDDTFTFSVMGSHGFGVMAEKAGIDLLLGSFSKCFGTYVSFFACTKQMKAHLFDKLPSLHRERQIPPLYLGMIDATIQLLPSMQAERKKIHQLSKLLYQTIRKLGYHAPESKSPFISIPFENPTELQNLQLHLADHSFIPSPSKTSLTLFPNLSLTEKEITQLFLTLSSFHTLPKFEAL